MATFELTGKLVEKYSEQNVTQSFVKREFVVEARENRNDRDFIESIKFQLIQDKCQLLDNFDTGDQVKVTFNIRGRRYDKDGKVSYFTNLEAWKIDRIGGVIEPERRPVEQVQQEDADSDLPF